MVYGRNMRWNLRQELRNRKGSAVRRKHQFRKEGWNTSLQLNANILGDSVHTTSRGEPGCCQPAGRLVGDVAVVAC